EKAVAITPPEYVNIYERSWSSDPDKRPALSEILTELEKLSLSKISKENSDFIYTSKFLSTPKTSQHHVVNIYSMNDYSNIGYDRMDFEIPVIPADVPVDAMEIHRSKRRKIDQESHI
ncbi:25207_t:CDS:2, partial [Gigaspora margarita]